MIPRALSKLSIFLLRIPFIVQLKSLLTAVKRKLLAVPIVALLIAKTKLLVFAALAAAFVATAVTGGYYVITKNPITNLPGIRALAKGIAPQYLTSFLGPNKPVGIALSADGSRLYVAQTAGDRTTLIYDNLFNPLGELTPPNTTEASRLPLYVAVDKEGVVYVTDRLRNVVDVYEPDGSYRMALSIGLDSIGAISPLAVGMGHDDDLIVTEGGGENRMFKVDKFTGEVLSMWGSYLTSGTPGGDMQFPNGMAEDKKGRYYCADGNGGRITQWEGNGEFKLAFALGEKEGSVGLPRGLALDDLGRLHIVDAATHNVVVYDINGEEPKYLYTFGEFGIDNGQFNYPSGVAIDNRKGLVYVADTFSHQVQVWAY